jgi:predicted nuclease with RNAse H fold
MTRWAGVDVGGRRKGFHAAVVDETCLVAGPVRLGNVAEAVAWLGGHDPALVAVDSPISAASEGAKSRPEERELAVAICGIRYTPDRAALSANTRYYEWIEHGFELYAALESAGLTAVECFPTASWTSWLGPRGTTSRAAWTRSGLATVCCQGLPGQTNQDERDALAAALTARECGQGRAASFGAIVVPR